MTEEKVRVISQAHFDKMVSGQQKFFLELVAQGRARIGDERAPTVHPTSPVVEKRKPPVHRLIDKKVTVTLVDGSTCTGILEEVFQYEIVVEGVVVFKGAIMTIVECA